MTTDTSEMLLASCNFALEMDRITVAYFRKCSGLSSGAEIKLTKSLDGNKDLTDWFKEVQDGKFDKTVATVQSSCTTRRERKLPAGTSSMGGPRSGQLRISTPALTTSPPKRSQSRMKG